MRAFLMILSHPLTPLVYFALQVGLPMLIEKLDPNEPARTYLRDAVTPLMAKHDAAMFMDPQSSNSSNWQVARRLDDDYLIGETEDLLVFTIVPTVVTIIVSLVIWFIAAVMYKSKVVDQRDPWPSNVDPNWSLKDKDFRYGPFQCCDDGQYCLHGCFCPDVRLGDTYQLTKVGTYWKFVIIWLIFYSLGCIMSSAISSAWAAAGLDRQSAPSQFGYYIANGFFALWMATQRTKLRQALGGNADGKFMEDCVCYWWCGCCLIIQEARQVDGATNSAVSCCCNLTKGLPPPAVVGAPVIIGQVVGTSQ